jgi:hypothetical protein
VAQEPSCQQIDITAEVLAYTAKAIFDNLFKYKHLCSLNLFENRKYFKI